MVAGQNGAQNEVTVFAYAFSATNAYHFVTIAPANASPFNSMYQSMRQLSATEAAAIKPRKVRVLTVGKGDTISSLAAKMAYTDLKTERFMALNGLRSDAALAVGKRIKIVTY
jgi:predicted Zn-dependent protease